MFCYCKSLKNQCYYFFLSFFRCLKATCMPTINSINKFLVDYIMKFPTKICCNMHERILIRFLTSCILENLANISCNQATWRTPTKVSLQATIQKKIQKFLATYMKNFQNKAFLTSF